MSIDIKLQDLMDITVSRIMLTIINLECHDQPIQQAVLTSKWGMDGASGFSEYKMKVTGNGNDSQIFMSSFVPLELTSGTKKLWLNPRTDSTRYCRPIHIQFEKETTDLIKLESEHIQNQINFLRPTKVSVDGFEVIVSYVFFLTMVDGKVVNVLTNTKSSQSCNICRATPTMMNHLDIIEKQNCDVTNFQFGISVLHARLRFLDYFLHLGYKMEAKCWQSRKEDQKKNIEKRKKIIQSELRRCLGIIVDKPKPGGAGSSNDGNTARKFFSNPEKVSEIIGKSISLY